MDLNTQFIISLLLVVAFFAFVILWVMFVQRRLRVWIREKLGEAWGVTIIEHVRYRNMWWELKGAHTRGQRVFANIVLIVTDFGCLVGPIFGALAAMVVVMMLLTDG